jgi:hypothetical protein
MLALSQADLPASVPACFSLMLVCHCGTPFHLLALYLQPVLSGLSVFLNDTTHVVTTTSRQDRPVYTGNSGWERVRDSTRYQQKELCKMSRGLLIFCLPDRLAAACTRLWETPCSRREPAFQRQGFAAEQCCRVCTTAHQISRLCSTCLSHHCSGM